MSLNNKLNMTKNVDSFLLKLSSIEKKLENLSREYVNLFIEYLGNNFKEQNFLSGNIMDNLVRSATHETASQIGFYRQEIIDLVKFISFRKTYKNYDDKDLGMIIDNENLSSTEKLILQRKTNNKIVIEIKEIVAIWNATFDNKRYSQIRERFLKAYDEYIQ
jgi:hypothetical protein